MQKSASESVVQLLSESQAAQEMWLYYKENKALLAHDIKEYRELILSNLMQGQAAIEVFAPFMQSAEMPVASKKTCKQRKSGKNEKTLRSPWPFATK